MASVALYLDEDINPGLAMILRERGFDVVSTTEAEMLGKSDSEQLEFATEHGRVLFTHNIGDYARLAHHYAKQTHPHSGIVVSDQLPLGELLRRTLRFLTARSQEAMINRFEWLNDYR
jgi:predicted nuclease of predicted toxin-antitoxin system